MKFPAVILLVGISMFATQASAVDNRLDYSPVDTDPLSIPYAMHAERAINDLYDRAGAAICANKMLEAVAALEKLVTLDSGAVQAFMMLGEVYFRMGRHEAAIGVADSIARIPEASVPATLLAMKSLDALGRHEESSLRGRRFSEVRQQDPMIRLQERIARTRSGQGAAVLDEFAGELNDRGVALNSANEIISAALFYIASGNRPAAEKCLNVIAENHGDRPASLAARTILKASRGSYADALSLARAATGSPYATADNWNNLAVLLSYSNHLDDARSCLDKAVAIDPGHFPAVHQLTSIMVSEGNVTGALAICGRALHVNSNSAVLHQRMGQLLIHSGDWTAAGQHLVRAQELRPDLKGPSFLLGLWAQTVGDEAASVRHYERELALNTNHVQSLNNLAWVKATSSNAQIRNLTQATDLSLRACELTSFKGVEELDTLIECLIRQGLNVKAKEVVERAMGGGSSFDETRMARLKQIAAKLKNAGTSGGGN